MLSVLTNWNGAEVSGGSVSCTVGQETRDEILLPGHQPSKGNLR